ncbi:uncharacterized protein [Pleurodeles waltl]|uniref:uncharacterized protein n=1 Tax=Pleurodeles waltl TaxID=8319 RepID=UPI0037097184
MVFSRHQQGWRYGAIVMVEGVGLIYLRETYLKVVWLARKGICVPFGLWGIPSCIGLRRRRPHVILEGNWKVYWMGKSGMRWGELLYFLSKRLAQGICPDLLVIHLGENDLVALSGIGLLKVMKLDLLRIRKKWAGTHIVWTELVPRRVWRGANSIKDIEKQCRKVNREMHSFCHSEGFSVLQHGEIVHGDVALFRQDGVHLSFLGNEHYLLELRMKLSELLGENLWDRGYFRYFGWGRKMSGLAWLVWRGLYGHALGGKGTDAQDERSGNLDMEQREEKARGIIEGGQLGRWVLDWSSQGGHGKGLLMRGKFCRVCGWVFRNFMY